MRTLLQLLVRGARYELALYRSLFRWLTRRPDVPPEAAGFGFAGPVLALLWVFIAVSAVELVVLHLILPWETIRIVADVLGVWGLVWMFGLLASFMVYPHVVDAFGLRVRRGVNVDIRIAWDAVATVRHRERGRDSSRAVQLDRGADGTVLHIVMGGRTNVDVTLRRPIVVPLPKGEQTVSELRFFADDARELARRAGGHLSESEAARR